MKRALISVYDKTEIVHFSKGLVELGWDIISTGGTYKLLRENNIPVVEIDEVTNFPEILDGRVKTLNPYIHGGILFKREEKSHREKIKELGIVGIDMVVNNLYPFEETIHKETATEEEIIENIDIGGPSMIRAAAKNFKDVIVLIDPKDYNRVLVELKENGEIDIDTKKEFAKKVFNYTAYYDALIAQYFNEDSRDDFPELLTLPYKKKAQLRYGENPHQRASFYIDHNQIEGTIAGMKQLHGKELSYNNINDANGAISLLKEFSEPTAVALKHVNPCGVGSAANIENAFKKAYECDRQSIFGGIVALNREVSKELAEHLKEIFLEIIIAPNYSKEAIEILTRKKNIRLLEIDHLSEWNYKRPSIKQVDGGLLVQDKNMDLFVEDLNIVTDEFPEEIEIDDMIFAWKVAKHISSNGIVVAKDNATLGIGLGEVNRIWAVEEAIQRAGKKAKGAVLASDGFFPFKDSIEAIAKAEISCIIQPGGSIKDDEVVHEANESKIKMVFTDIRHFRH
ncbi:MAG: bifunctional phosphoribosylaminoimidazolecarboxamide formyltransferase/IMP cyclohydrolase [Gudongella sp.]|nr:bifunctional phosphoribosylaminoimidazolecarboxamide formyltransferase/IMP cyclohydrolase [Gudongella sp.]